MKKLVTKAVIDEIVTDIQSGRPYSFTPVQSIRIMSKLFEDKEKLNLIKMIDTVMTNNLRNKKLILLVDEIVTEYLTKVIPIPIEVEFHVDIEDHVFIYIRGTKSLKRPFGYISGEVDFEWGKQSSDELKLISNTTMKTLFDFKNTILSYKSFDIMLDKVRKKYKKGKVAKHDYRNKNDIWRESESLFADYLGTLYGGTIIFRPTEYLSNFSDENNCLVVEFEPNNKTGLYLKYLEGEL